MRLLHVADWHLGRSHGHTSRREDLVEVLEQTVSVARDFRPDLVVHAGDIFDAPRPSVDDLQLACDTLRQLGEVAPVVVLAGNHDSPQLLSFIGGILAPGRIYFADAVKQPADGGVLDFETSSDQRIRLASVPFVSAHRMVKTFENPQTWTASYADRLRAIIGVLADGLDNGLQRDRDVLVLAAHLHVTGAEVTQSERPFTVSDGYGTHAGALPAVSYAAFGHIHRHQALPQASVTGCYAGSPIQLDFGEEHDAKVCVLVEANPGRPAEVTTHAYSIRRPLWRFEGTLDELRTACTDVKEALCRVVIHTEEPARELAAQVQELLPDATLLEIDEVCASQQARALTTADLPAEEELSIDAQFEQYVAEVGVRGSTVGSVLDTFRRLDALQAPSDLPEIPSPPDAEPAEVSS
jgi:exonuclease SbcD